MKYNPKKAAKIIRGKRLWLDITQEEMEEKSQISQALISFYENGLVNDPPIRTLEKIAKILKLDMRKFFT